MKTMLALLIVLLLFVGTVAFALPTVSPLPAPAQPSSILAIEDGANPVPFIACIGEACGCPDC